MTPYWVPRPQWVYEKIHWPRSLLGTKYEMIFKSMSSVTKDIPYIVLTNELYDVCCEEINLVLTLRPSDAIWWHESGSTFAQAITCSLTAPSHYQNQYWHISVKSSDIYLKVILHVIHWPSIIKICLNITYLKFHTNIPGANVLTHWGRVTHICVNKLTIIGSDNGLPPGQHHAIICTDAGLLLIGPLGTNFSEILIEILIFSFKKMRLKVSSAKRWPFCLGLNVLTHQGQMI